MLRSCVPTHDNSIQILGNDRIVRRFHNGCQSKPRFHSRLLAGKLLSFALGSFPFFANGCQCQTRYRNHSKEHIQQNSVHQWGVGRERPGAKCGLYRGYQCNQKSCQARSAHPKTDRRPNYEWQDCERQNVQSDWN